MSARPWGGLLLIALTATTMVAPADSAPSSGTSSGASGSTSVGASRPKSASVAGSRKTSKRRTRRGRRRLPPGGVWARNAVVLDPITGEVLYEKNAAATVPIASLSKLMTAIVFLELDPDLDRKVEVTREELQGGGRTQLRNHELIMLRDLLHMSLMVSDNVATRVLARETGLSKEDFLAKMNRKAMEIGLARTRFVEPTGLDERNVSTASDCARLLRAAAEDKRIQAIMTRRSHEFRTSRGPHTVGNTNRLLYGRYEIKGGKTGFIAEAGYCLATWVHTQGRDMIAVVLGAPTAATRFADVVRLVQRTTSPAVTPTP